MLGRAPRLYNHGVLALETQIGQELRARRLTLAVAESCTGGLVGHRLTNVAGSSEYFLGGLITYANAAKRDLLGVPPATLETFGAVSAETAQAMAHGARRALNADLGLAVTGIAGPGGGTPEKPVGLTWLGLSAGAAAWTRRCQWDADRVGNKERSAEAALQLLLDYLAGRLPPPSP